MSRQGQWETFKKELCDILTRIGALNFGVFNLADGRLSPYYIDLRIVPSFPEAFAKVEKLYLEVAKRDLDLKDVVRIAGIPTAGIPFAAVLAFSLNKPFLYVRSDVTHGRGRKVEGILNPGESVLIVDDLAMTGKTILTAADSIRSEGGVVKDALTLIDRQEGSCAALETQGIRLHYLINMKEVAETLYDVGAIEKEQMKSILSQIVL